MANNVKFEIKVGKDLREQILKATEEQIALALEACGSAVERNASDYCPFDTGFLRNKITYALSGEAPKKTTYSATLYEHFIYEYDLLNEPEVRNAIEGNKKVLIPHILIFHTWGNRHHIWKDRAIMLLTT